MGANLFAGKAEIDPLLTIGNEMLSRTVVSALKTDAGLCAYSKSPITKRLRSVLKTPQSRSSIPHLLLSKLLYR